MDEFWTKFPQYGCSSVHKQERAREKEQQRLVFARTADAIFGLLFLSLERRLHRFKRKIRIVNRKLKIHGYILKALKVKLNSLLLF